MPTTDNVLEIVLEGKGATDGVPIINTFYYAEVPSGTEDLPSFAANWKLNFFADFKTMVTTEWEGVQAKYTFINGPLIGVQYIDFTIAGVTGTLGGPTADYSQAFMVRRSGPTNNRKDRGRLFIAPVQRAVFNDAGQLIAPPAALAAVLADVIAVIPDTPGNNYFPVLWSKALTIATPVVVAGYSQRAGIRKKRRFKP